MEILDKLNKQQLNAVTAGNGPILVVAGPGSGKTRVLTQRIAYLIAVEGVRPWQILAVTFTNKAAKEMGERVKRLLPDQATEGIMLGTFHSICARILRREADYLPIGSNFVIFDTDDQERIVKAVIRELNINEKLYRPASVHGALPGALHPVASGLPSLRRSDTRPRRNSARNPASVALALTAPRRYAGPTARSDGA